MKQNNILYEQIMRSVSREIRKVLNEESLGWHNPTVTIDINEVLSIYCDYAGIDIDNPDENGAELIKMIRDGIIKFAREGKRGTKVQCKSNTIIDLANLTITFDNITPKNIYAIISDIDYQLFMLLQMMNIDMYLSIFDHMIDFEALKQEDPESYQKIMDKFEKKHDGIRLYYNKRRDIYDKYRTYKSSYKG